MNELTMLSDLARSWWGAWLMVLFLGIVWWAFRPGNRARFEACGDIPLKDDATGEER